jgi:hypothetical protein
MFLKILNASFVASDERTAHQNGPAAAVKHLLTTRNRSNAESGDAGSQHSDRPQVGNRWNDYNVRKSSRCFGLDV